MQQLQCKQKNTEMKNSIYSIHHLMFVPDAMDVLYSISYLSSQLLFVKFNLATKYSLWWWSCINEKHERHGRLTQSNTQNTNSTNSQFTILCCYRNTNITIIIKVLLTRTSSNGKRSWKMRLILAPPDNSRVSISDPAPSMLFSNSWLNVVTILKHQKLSQSISQSISQSVNL